MLARRIVLWNGVAWRGLAWHGMGRIVFYLWTFSGQLFLSLYSSCRALRSHIPIPHMPKSAPPSKEFTGGAYLLPLTTPGISGECIQIEKKAMAWKY